MTKQLLSVSSKIEPELLPIYEDIHNQAKLLNIPFMVVGAAARDILLKYGYGKEVKRATLDVDFGIEVNDWELHKKLKNALTKLSDWSPSKRIVQRIYFKNTAVDIVPFGGIEENGCISWPGEDSKMVVTGFEEAYQNALTVEIKDNPHLEMKVASLAGLTTMKTISWDDGDGRKEKDAKDLALILENYLDAGNYDRLCENENLDILEDNFDYDYSGARLLGRDVQRIAKPETFKKVLDIIKQQSADSDDSELANCMITVRHGDDEHKKMFTLLEQFHIGLTDKL